MPAMNCSPSDNRPSLPSVPRLGLFGVASLGLEWWRTSWLIRSFYLPLVVMLPFVVLEILSPAMRDLLPVSPLLWIVLAGLAWKMRTKHSATENTHPPVSWQISATTEIMVAVAWLVFLFGLFDKQLVFCCYAFLLVLLSANLRYRKFSPAYSVTLLAWAVALSLPLPFSWDQAISRTIQRFAIQLCSISLDSLYIPHFLIGDFLYQNQQILEVSKFCKHPFDFHTVAAVTLIFLVIKRKSLLLTLCAMGLVPILAILNTYISFLIVAIGCHLLHHDLTSGWEYGFAISISFAYTLAFSLVVLRTLDSIFRPFPDVGFHSEMLLPQSLSYLLSWPNHEPLQLSWPAASNIETVSSTELPASPLRQRSLATANLIYLTLVTILILLSLFYGMKASYQIAKIWLPDHSENSPNVRLSLPVLQSHLPQELGPWRQMGFREHNIKLPTGEFLIAEWDYACMNKKATLSLISHYPRYWYPTLPLENLGWRISRQLPDVSLAFQASMGSEDDRDILQIWQLRDRFGLAGYLLSSSLQRWELNWNYLAEPTASLPHTPKQFPMTTCKLRVFCETGELVSNSEIVSLKDLLSDARQQLLNKHTSLPNPEDLNHNL